jgi:hypothetical protein
MARPLRGFGMKRIIRPPGGGAGLVEQVEADAVTDLVAQEGIVRSVVEENPLCA